MVNPPYIVKTTTVNVDHNLRGVYQKDTHLCLIIYGSNHSLHDHRQTMEHHLRYDILCPGRHKVQVHTNSDLRRKSILGGLDG